MSAFVRMDVDLGRVYLHCSIQICGYQHNRKAGIWKLWNVIVLNNFQY